jgi:dipeptidyl aminopeptidase/acylaminoacyl peptidase
MKKFLLIAVALLAWGTSFAQEAPLIDREIFFDNPEIAGAQLSPDAKWMTFTKAHKGTMNIWLKRADEPFEAAKPITADTVRPIRGYFWTDDSRYVLYGQDKGGNEDFHVYAVDPFAKAEAATGVPPSRDLTPYEKTTAQIYRVSKKDPNKIWVGLNDRDQAWHDLYEINIATGARKLLRQNDDRITGWDFDWDENLRFASRSKDDGTTDFLRVDADKLTEIYKIGPLDEAFIVSFTKDNKQPYFVTNKDRNFTELTLLDPATGKETFVEKDPLGKVDFGGASFNDLSREMEYSLYTDSKNRIYWKDKKMQAEYEALQKKFPGKEIDYVSLDKKQEKALLRVWSDTDPGAVYFYDRKTGKTTFQYRPRPKLKPEHLAPMQAITYKSSDGLEIPAFLTTPKGKEAKNLPLMVIPHGGPWARDFWGYNSYAQFWSNRGYAVLQMNFRGSTGYGKDFLNKGNGEWGQLMQDDITWGVKDLVAKGIADPNRVGILGGSYGGYATLAGVTYTPDLYKAAVAIVAPSNLNTLLASIPSYWESFRKIMYLRMADPNTPEGKAQLERQSPLNHVDKIKTPLLIVQGANDPRVKKAEADQIVVAMREKGIPVEYICAPDEGHGFARPVNNMAYLASAEKFLATRLGGRYQTSMTDEVAKRLAEITVDVKTVEKPKRADEIAAMAAGKTAKPIYDLTPGTFEYKIEIALGAQKIPMSDQRTVKSKGDNWEVSDAMTSMMGIMSDVNLVRKKTLQPIKRDSKQGPVTMEMEFTATEVKGKINMGDGADQPFSVANDKPLAPDGAGGDLFLAALDWKEGATYYYTTFDPQSQQLNTQEAKALRKEKVTVPAGTYDAWVVEVKNTDGSGGGSTHWIAENLSVKSVTSIPEMGGALLTVELVKFEYERP